MNNTKNSSHNSMLSAIAKVFIISAILVFSKESLADSCEKSLAEKNNPLEIYLSLNKLFQDAITNKREDLNSCLFVQINLAKSKLLLEKRLHEKEKLKIQNQRISEHHDMEICLINAKISGEKEFKERNFDSLSRLSIMIERRNSHQKELLESMNKGTNFFNKIKQDSLKKKINEITERINIQQQLLSEEIKKSALNHTKKCTTPGTSNTTKKESLSIDRKIDEIDSTLKAIDDLSDAASSTFGIDFQ